MTARLTPVLVLLLAACSTSAPPSAESASPHAPAAPGWRQHETERPQPPRVEPAEADLPVAPPSDAVVLIGPDGDPGEHWQSFSGDPIAWTVTDGALVVTPGTGPIQTRESFGDAQIHIEWKPAAEPEKTSQDRSNSGLFLVDERYEVQILDNWENETYADGRAAAIYGQFPPLAAANRPPDAWQSYDVFFRMPRFADDGTVMEEARLTVLHNGVLVQNNEVLPGMTIWLESLPYEAHGEGPISLQDHGSPAQFRNLWVRRLPEREAPPADYALEEGIDLTDEQEARILGRYAREGGGTFVFERLGDGLGMSMPWRSGVLPLVPLSPTRLHLKNTNGVFDFEMDADGAVTALTFTMGGARYRATPE
ncbi:MAG: DUF1080 domain-containing protein [Bacteroidota bacterium]